jgi:hypothetical protein
LPFGSRLRFQSFGVGELEPGLGKREDSLPVFAAHVISQSCALACALKKLRDAHYTAPHKQ